MHEENTLLDVGVHFPSLTTLVKSIASGEDDMAYSSRGFKTKAICRLSATRLAFLWLGHLPWSSEMKPGF
jgi:hypothetical protein